MTDLGTSIDGLELVKPNVDRDAPTSVQWLNGAEGRNTMLLMGNAPDNIGPTTLAAEQQRIREFLTATDQITWTIRYQQQTVGAVWINLEATDYLPAPSIHIMLGDPTVRGKGLGSATFTTVLDYLEKHHDYPQIYSRFLHTNSGSAALLTKLGFKLLGNAYKDADGLQFQNVVRVLTTHS